MALVSRVAVPWSRVPFAALEETSARSSSGERAERSSWAGSTPMPRTIQFASEFSP